MSLKKKTQSIRLNEVELANFCRQIGMVISAGLPIYYGISILMGEAEDENTKALYESLYEPMETGVSFNQALKEVDCFPEYMVKMIQLGEETGRLDNVLASLATYYEREDQIRTSIRRAAFYPLIMTMLMVVVIIVLMTKVLPIFANIYEELGSELTGVARTLLTISTNMNRYLAVIVILFLVLVTAGLIIFHTHFGRVMFQGSKLYISIAASRFANSMYLSLASGLDTDRGLDMALSLVNNPHMEQRIQKCKEHIKHGENFENALQKSGIFSKVYSSWIAIAYRTGDMESVMLRISEAYEEDTDERISRAIATIEPTLVIILCFFVGLILISFLLPLLGIMQSIG
ncbi:type II secretion system F family protein [Agathobacter ruminis]|uniref:Pilus assembly protein PilC n=1 Tax=Agathobacter ruminis TaxID=1712665 RepID=A0A2G3E2I9_9FIRM|nr:type II secretion system F family protein [Agathobacter ruminis]MDC7301024.1 type II secretion system F family protein [Agathobacter ruminis]PHU37474.1 pilus assembly protein PilC [Agathobacter ruminis]